MYLAKANAEAALGTANPIRNETQPDKKAGNGPIGLVEVNIIPAGLWKGRRKFGERQRPADRRDSSQNPQQQHPLVAPDVQHREARCRQNASTNHPCNHDEYRCRQTQNRLASRGRLRRYLRHESVLSLILFIKEASARWKKTV